MRMSINLALSGTVTFAPPPAAEEPGGGGAVNLWPQETFDSGAGLTLIRSSVSGGQLTLSPEDNDGDVMFSQASAAAAQPLAVGTYRVQFTLVSSNGPSANVNIAGTAVSSATSSVGNFDAEVAVPSISSQFITVQSEDAPGSIVIDNLIVTKIA